MLLTLFAILVTSFRVLLPHLDYFQNDIARWLNEATGLQFHAQNISGYWDNLHPYISLQDFSAQLPDGSKVKLSADEIDVEIDFWQSILKMQPIVADLRVNGLDLDIRTINLNSPDSTSTQDNHTEDQDFLNTVDKLMLRQFDGFSLKNSNVYYQSLDGGTRKLNIDTLRWKNQGRHHRFQGVVSITDAKINSLHVNANFVDHGSLRNVSGEFYVSAHNVLVAPWLTKHLKLETGIEKGEVSFKSWLTLKNSQPVEALVKLEPSELTWKGDKNHQLTVKTGVFNLSPEGEGWKVIGQSLDIETNHKKWPNLEVAFDWQPKQWRSMSLNLIFLQ